MGEELDNPRVLKRLAWSGLASLLAAAVGGAVAMAVHPLLVSMNVKPFMGWGAFLSMELGSLICAVIGFIWTWRRLTPQAASAQKSTEREADRANAANHIIQRDRKWE